MIRVFIIACMTALLFMIAGIEFGKYKGCDGRYNWDFGRCEK